jgi:hypothetical protein
MAAQDKVGRYEVPRADIATMKKIANPLKLGVMHEAAFVLGHDWPQLIEREAAQLPELKVSDLRGFIEKEQPGLPDNVRDLVVVCYAIQADKAWARGGQPITMPPLTRLHDDMVLRGQELPTEDEFERASRRAQGIFQVTAQPVLSTRSTELTARAVRERASALLPAAESLAGELDRHAKTLGLDEEQPRLVTSRAITALLTRLVAATDPTQSVRLLATAELSRENAIYLAHLTSAEVLTAVLRGRNWQVLNDLADRTAAGEDPEAAAIISALRAAARHDEHEAPLAGPLRNADQAGLDLIMSRTKTPPGPPPAPQPGPVLTRRVRASDVPSVVERICEAADANPAAEFEITWRIVTGDGEH